ncbi:hypothetical protein FPOA_00999 [Fusarium poae]|uniref:Uncharacterized protein n=1 Tax=Fusarium poae TaxID=36050 RepID=A0A1B8B2W4_FUSPO|nr:hypothetical protein FPOA_00999 [Fusarium poae]
MTITGWQKPAVFNAVSSAVFYQQQTSFVSWLPFKLCPLRHIYTITFDAQILHSHLQQLAPCPRVTEASKPPSWNPV